MSAAFAPWIELGPGRIARDRFAPVAAAEPDSPTVEDIERAAERIRPHTLATPLVELGLAGLDASAKLETHQRTGSMKARGAASRLVAMGADERAAGVVTASSGNHGRALAELAAELGIPATVCVPSWVDTVKLEAIRASGASIRGDAGSYDAAVLLADSLAAAERMVAVHSFDDPMVIAGQGTIGLELCAQCADLDAILMPLSGGGLAAGIALAVAQRSPTTRLIGVSATNASVLYRCLLAGRRIAVAELPTIASALCGGLGARNRHSLAIVAALLDQVWQVQETEIARAMLWADQQLGERIEGGGAVALAPLLRPDAAAMLRATAKTSRTPRVAAVLSGGNVDAPTWARAQALVA